MAMAFEAQVEAMMVRREEEEEGIDKEEKAELLALAIDTGSSLLSVYLLSIVRKELVADNVALLLKDHPRC